MNTKNIKTLVDIMEKSSLTALEIEEAECKIRLERNVQNQVLAMPTPIVQQPAVITSAPQTVPAETPANVPNPAPVPAKAGKEVKSPMVGVFYAASSPEAEPFVTVGSKVKKGDVLCIVEAMKLMNEIQAEEDGEITEVCVQSGQIVEYAQVLFKMN